MSKNLCVDIENLIKNDDFKIKFNNLYPDFNLNNLDKEIMVDLVLDMYYKKQIDLPKISNIENIDSIDYDIKTLESNPNEIKELVEEYGIEKNFKKTNKIILNRLKADDNIPHLFVPGDLIIINGILISNCVKILVDTGASLCCITKSCVKKCELLNLVDKSMITRMKGSNNIFNTWGKIWYTELGIKNNETVVDFPISLEVINDIEDDFDIILGNNFLRTYNATFNFNQRIITLESNTNNILVINYQ